MAVSIKKNRIDFRVDDVNKKILETAAELNHVSLTSYILSVVLKQAELDIQKSEELKLNSIDRDIVMKLLDDPVEPNDNLVRLMRWSSNQ